MTSPNTARATRARKKKSDQLRIMRPLYIEALQLLTKIKNSGVNEFASEIQELLARAGEVPVQTSSTIVSVVYTNWRGETRERRILPVHLHFGSNEWHKTPIWMLRCIDAETGQERDFALSKVLWPMNEPSLAADIERVQQLKIAIAERLK